MSTPRVRASLAGAVAVEVTAQLRELKQQLNEDLLEDMQEMKKDIVREIVSQFRLEISRSIAKACDEIRREFIGQPSTDDKQLSVALKESRRETHALITAAGERITKQVYSNVMQEIANKIVPAVDNAMEFIKHQTADGGEIVTNYRRAVERQEYPRTRQKLIEGGKTDKRIITEHVRLFFDKEESDSGDE